MQWLNRVPYQPSISLLHSFSLSVSIFLLPENGAENVEFHKTGKIKFLKLKLDGDCCGNCLISLDYSHNRLFLWCQRMNRCIWINFANIFYSPRRTGNFDTKAWRKPTQPHRLIFFSSIHMRIWCIPATRQAQPRVCTEKHFHRRKSRPPPTI